MNEEFNKSVPLDEQSETLATKGTQESVQSETEVSSIDFVKLWNDVLKHRKLYYKVLPITFVIAAFLTLSIPNYYNCEVKLSPEMSGSSSSSSLLSLASSFGVNLGKMGGMGTEALFPTLYPDLMNSVDFKTSLFPVPVTIEGDKDKGEEDRTMSYYDYMENEQKAPWWSVAMKGIGDGIKYVKSLITGEEEEETTDVNPFRLTKEQTEIVKAIDENIVCDVDKKTMVISINVTDQDPVICATMADTVKTRLQNFITDYRTSKARVDLEYNKKLYAETKVRYDKARRLYAEFADANQDIILQTVRQRQVELENEMQIQYNAFTQVSAQLLAAEAKVQEETPAFTTLQSATVPVKKTGPKRAKICLFFLFLAFLATTAWILHKEDDLKPLLGLS